MQDHSKTQAFLGFVLQQYANQPLASCPLSPSGKHPQPHRHSARCGLDTPAAGAGGKARSFQTAPSRPTGSITRVGGAPAFGGPPLPH